MIILALDTSAAASAALVDADTEEVLAERTVFSARKHAELLGPAIRELLAGGPAPHRVIVGVGPGPFTGLRAGIATGIGFALGAGVPVDGLPSHDALALRALRGAADAGAASAAGPGLLVATDARRKEVYWTRYSGLDDRGVPVVVSGPAVDRPSEVPVAGPGAEGAHAGSGGTELRYGRGFALYLDALGAPTGTEPADLEPTAGDLGIVAARLLAAGRPLLPTVPLYLREPDARPPAERTTSLR